MNTEKKLLGIFYKLNSEKRDTSLQRSSVQTPARGTSQPSQVVASQSSQGTSQPSRVTSSQQPSQRTSQFSRVTATLTSPVVASQFSRMMAPQPSQGTAQLSRVVAPQPSRARASLAPPPAPPIPTPTPPAQPCCRRLSKLLSRGPRRLQQCSSLLWQRISSPEKNLFHLPRAKVAAESAGGAEGSRGTAKPLPPIQPPTAAASSPATTRVQPKSQVAPKSRAPPPKKRNPRGAPQAGTGPLPNSRLCTSQQQQQQQQQLQLHPPQQPRRSSPTRIRGRSVRNPGAASSPELASAVPETQYNIILTTEATWLLLRRHLENQWGWMNPLGGTGLLPGSQSRAGLDLSSLMKISLVNSQNRYDDEEYKEDPAPGVVNQELVCRCTEWLRGVEEARREGQLETVPYLDDP